MTNLEQTRSFYPAKKLSAIQLHQVKQSSYL